MILFFSSDVNALFQKDVLSVLSLPKGHCVHFRYWESILSPDILRNINSLIGREGLIIYVKGNDPRIPESQRNVTFFPVRRVNITNCRKDEQTRLIHFNLELTEFVDATVNYPAVNLRPPYVFVEYGSIATSVYKPWYEKVEDLVRFDASFENSLFFNIKLLDFREGHPTSIDIPFDKDEEASSYKLSEGKSYILDLSIMISDQNFLDLEKYECKLVYDEKDIMISNPDNIVIGTQKDNRRYKLVTKSIENVRSFDYLKIIATKKSGTGEINNFYETIIRFKVCKNAGKAIGFVVLFFLNVIGTALFAFAISDEKFMLILPALFLVMISALGQYYYYNKT